MTNTNATMRWMHRYLLVLRFSLLNVVATGLTVAVYLQGWLDGAFAGETMWLSLGIITVFLYGMMLCATRVWHTSVDLNDVRLGSPHPTSRAGAYLENVRKQPAESRFISANLLRIRLLNHIAIVRHIANTLVLLGLVGTVIGFIIALSGVKPEATVQVEQVAPMVGTLIKGMSIALYTTLVGAVLHVWLMTNHRLLSTGTVHLFNAIVELGERRVGA